MSLYTINFIFFLACVGLVYYLAPQRWRWIILLASSLFFYATYSAISAFAFGLVIVVNYVCALSMSRVNVDKRKPLMVAGIAFNLAVLIFYKFLPTLFGGLLTRADSSLTAWLILPLGLSFQILQAIGYLVEVRKGAQPAERHFGIFALYILFFPRLLAGPVEKPQSLINQFREEHPFNYKDVTDGMKVLAWGLFKKLVIADRLAFVVASAYADPQSQDGVHLFFASLAFFVSIYADFSGYSDIAWGAARIFGIRITQNFNHPYASLSIAEFWQRWHISLSSWLREYLYFPLGGNRKGEARTYINLILTMSLSSMWHEINPTFLVWGTLHGVYLAFFRFSDPFWERLRRAVRLDKFPRLTNFIRWGTTMFLLLFTYIIFRADTLSDAWYIMTHMFVGLRDYAFDSIRLLAQTLPTFNGQVILNALLEIASPLTLEKGAEALVTCATLLAFLLLEWAQFDPAQLSSKPVYVRWTAYALIIASLMFFTLAYDQSQQQFFYFKF